MINKKTVLPFAILTSLLLVGCTNNANNSSSINKPNLSETSQPSSTDLPATSENKPTSEDTYSEEELEETYFNPFNKEAVDVTIRDLLNISKNRTDGTLYRVTGTMQYVTHTGYGNFDLTDETGSICVYGLSRNRNSIKGSGRNHTFTNMEDFTRIGLRGGDQVTIECIHLYHTDGSYAVPEIQGYAVKGIKKQRWDIKPLSYAEKDTYVGNYYDSIGDEKGLDLGLKLHNLMMTTHKNSVSYESLSSHFKKSDSKNGNTPYCFYTNKPAQNLNREHVWPQSLSHSLWGKTGGGCDIHHLRAASKYVNEKRGNRRFGPLFEKQYLNTIDYEGGNPNYYAADVSNVGVWEPADDIKGDVARIIAYTFMHYTNSLRGIINETTGNIHLDDVLAVGEECEDLLRYWNAIDPVDKWEMQRNEYAYSIQGNRNPFIDHPSYMDLMFAK